jgi:hypothetical protein
MGIYSHRNLGAAEFGLQGIHQINGTVIAYGDILKMKSVPGNAKIGIVDMGGPIIFTPEGTDNHIAGPVGQTLPIEPGLIDGHAILSGNNLDFGIVNRVYPGGQQYGHGFGFGSIHKISRRCSKVVIYMGIYRGNKFIRQTTVYIDGFLPQGYGFTPVFYPASKKINRIQRVQRSPQWSGRGRDNHYRGQTVRGIRQ